VYIVPLAKYNINTFKSITESKAIIMKSSSALQLVQLVYFGELAQIVALILLCYLALHEGDSESLAKAEVLAALKWALKWASNQVNLIQNPVLENLLP